MMPKGKLGRGKVFEGWWSSSCKSLEPHSKVGSQWTQNNHERSVYWGNWASSGDWEHCADCLYRWLGYACWQWCSWPHWWLHTPILHGPPCWGTETVSCHWVGCCAYSCLASPPSMDMEITATWLRSGEHKKLFQHITGRRWFITYLLWCVFVYCTFLQVMVGISGSPEAAQGITSSLPASWRYSPPGLTLK